MQTSIKLRAVGPEYLWISSPGSSATLFVRRSAPIDNRGCSQVEPSWCDRIGALLCEA